MKRSILSLSGGAAVVGLLATTTSPAGAQLEPRQHGAISYVSGGVGREERRELEAMSANYNVRVVITKDSGHLVGKARITLRAADGQVVLDTAADGPITLVKLAPGSYSLTCDDGAMPLTRNFEVGKNQLKRMTCRWAGEK